MSRYGNNHRGGRPKGSVAKSTLEALTAKQHLIDLYTKNAEAVHAALLHSAIGGDMTAIKELLDRVHGKPLATSEVKNVKEYRLDDAQLKQAADGLTELQKSNTGTNQSSA